MSLIALPAAAQSVEAGTIIENTARATYTTDDGAATVTSNTVELAVDELLDVTLTSLDGAPIGATPGSATLTFDLTNTGNGPEAFRLTANPSVAGNDFDTVVDFIAVDRNGNGVYDDGIDQILTGPETTQILAQDESLTVFVVVDVPNTVTDGQQSDVELRADAVTGTGTPGTVFAGQGVDGVDAVTGNTSAAATALGSLIAGITTVELVKSQSVADPFGGSTVVPGSTITYTITATVSGSGTVSDLAITDAFPAGTTYSPSTITLEGAPLTDTAGDDAGEVTASGIVVELGTLSGGTTQVTTFDVVVD
ncbi:hypothetical protein [Aurantiacibacter aquimixticola]|uniref:hypothetical protein n=1 Tax=Aurantiacibacter aquimixticola TaxID=1958945 RepID=UPI001F5B2964|nr:hypothetical protein [Aurantiacibacter aquimixticola]